MRRTCLAFAFAVAAACGWPATKMVPVADYASRAKPTISGVRTYEAGSDYQRTYSPDGATVFVCADRRVVSAAHVTPDAAPAC
jgi:hypothetical protein